MSDMHHPVHDAPPSDGPVERVDPRDFLDPTARAVAYLDLDDPDGARRALAEMSLHRLRRLGEHYDRLSMMCFELASPAGHTPDLRTVEPPEPPVSTPDVADEAAERAAGRLAAAYRDDAERHALAALPEIVFEVDDLADLDHADTAGRNPL
jgi:hypothetical protein